MEACQHRRHKVRMENSNPKIINDRNIWHNSNNRPSAENNPHDSISNEVHKALTNTSYEQLLKKIEDGTCEPPVVHATKRSELRLTLVDAEPTHCSTKGKQTTRHNGAHVTTAID